MGGQLTAIFRAWMGGQLTAIFRAWMGGQLTAIFRAWMGGQLTAIFHAWMGGQHTAMCHVDSKLFESIVVAGCSEVHITGHDCSVVVLSLHAGLITDPMALYRESKFTNIWTDEEKRVFKEK